MSGVDTTSEGEWMQENVTAFKEPTSHLYTLNLRGYSWRLTFDCDHNFRATGGEDVCVVEAVGGDAHIGAAVFGSRSEDGTDHPVSNGLLLQLETSRHHAHAHI